MKFLDSINCPIDNNVSLIEASAGTGKTYNIQNIFVRMIMEKNFPIESILVVTFTEAATRELKSRIRSILTELNAYFENGNSFERILSLATSGSIPKEIKKERIAKAIREFDKASIFTIHGFCKKMLDEYTFTTSGYFNQELKKNRDDILIRIVQNFIRKNFYQISEIEHYLNENLEINFDSCLYFIKVISNKIDFKFAEIYSVNDIQSQINKFKSELDKLYDREQIQQQLSADIISQAIGKYNPIDLNTALDEVENFLNNQLSYSTFKLIKKFTTPKLEAALKRNKVLPENDFFTKMDEFFQILEEYKFSIYQKLYNFYNLEFEREKLQGKFRTFDDLISILQKNLESKPELSIEISKSFSAVLIDEFQDTDSLQYSIFKKLFIEQNKPSFLIGDPKQAIYSFRGGDIYTYKKAKMEAESGNLYTLPVNYRSTEKMVNGINDLFQSLPKGREFLNDFINYIEVNAQENLDDKMLYKGKEIEESIEILYTQKPSNAPSRELFTIYSTASQISLLLNNHDYKILETGINRPIIPSDIAILVNEHRQATALLPVLKNLNIPAVLQATGSVFDSDDANDLNLLLKAINQPNNLFTVRAALLTPIFNISIEEIHKMNSDDSDEMEKWIQFFKNCNRYWQNGTFIEAFNFILSDLNLKQYLLSQNSGERKITNLYHLQELILKKEKESSVGMSGICNWFNRQLDTNQRDKEDDSEIRLETDDNALKIMTIHKSKGLEFPIVFCPFLWSKDQKIKKETFIQYHNESNQKILDFQHLEQEKAEQEKLEEAIRLAYVAITRAKYKVFMVAVDISKSLNVMRYFLKQFENCNSQEIVSLLKNNSTIESKDFANSTKIKLTKTEEAEKPLNKYNPDKMDSQKLSELHFDGDLKKQWDVNSFSSLAKSNLKYQFDEIKDYDDEVKEQELDVDELNIFTFPAGAKVGSCWHSIFEEISFDDNLLDIRIKCEEKLTTFGIVQETMDQKIKEEFINISQEMVENVLNCNLSKEKPISLKNINNEKRLVELEFFFSLKNDVEITKINQILTKYNINFAESIPKGFITGFIDLIFEYEGKYFILDWKSNALGQTIKDFSLENIKIEMHEHKYNLQYLIYTVALHKYLKIRIPDYDYNEYFGGVFYIFLRGVQKGIPGSGVFYDFPEKELIMELSEVLG